MLYDCSEVRKQLARWKHITSEWNDLKSAEIEKEYIEQLQSGITAMFEKLYEIQDFIAVTERQLENIQEVF